MKIASEIDLQWEETKRIVDKRDGSKCQFNKCLSIKESKQMVAGSPKTINRCHIFSRASSPRNKYNPKNIISLKQYIHERMDGYRNPVTNENISLNEHYYWWFRILKKSTESYNDSVDYKQEVTKIIQPRSESHNQQTIPRNQIHTQSAS